MIFKNIWRCLYIFIINLEDIHIPGVGTILWGFKRRDCQVRKKLTSSTLPRVRLIKNKSLYPLDVFPKFSQNYMLLETEGSSGI